MNDWLLLVWLLLSVLWDTVCIGVTGYLVFWRGHSGWWFVLALALCCNTTLLKVLRKRYGVPEEED